MYRRPTHEAMAALNNLGGDWSCERTESGAHWYAVKMDDQGDPVKLTMPMRSAGAAIRHLFEIIARNFS